MSMILLASKGRQTPSPPTPSGPPAIGDFYQGGYYFGRIVISGMAYYLIKAPDAACTSLAYKTAGTADNVGLSVVDGLVNTNALVAATGYPAASYCANLDFNGYNDWYLMSRDEQELMYRNLKGSTTSNNTSTRTALVGGGAMGVNSNSDPLGVAYTATVPPRCPIPLFQDPTGTERLSARGSQMWSSTTTQSGSSSSAICVILDSGLQSTNFKTTALAVVPIRRVPVPVADVSVPGTAVQGGYYFGMIQIGADIYKLIVAPVVARTNALMYKIDTTDDPTANSMNDGLANSNAINDSSHPAAQYCRAFAGSGFNDWYLPAADELELYYRNLKNSSTANQTGARFGRTGNQGENANSIPVGVTYTATVPGATPNSTFISPSGTQAAANSSYWTSTQATDVVTGALTQNLQNGGQSRTQKNAASGTAYTQPIRRVKIDVPAEPALGSAYEGGFYAGRIALNGNIYNLVVSPKSSEANMVFSSSNTTIAYPTNTRGDGATNTANLLAQDSALFVAAKYCDDLTVGGKTDWYLPSLDELELMYRNFKPNTVNNYTAARATGLPPGNTGENPTSIPANSGYTTTVPARTSIAAFQSGGAQVIGGNVSNFWQTWTSTVDNRGLPFVNGIYISFDATTNPGFNGLVAPSSPLYTVRAVRKVKVA